MRQLLPQVPQYFKSNLHAHSTISDGHLSPQQIKQAYKDLGYQILSITDHNVIVDHSAMTEPDFLMLTGIEINVNSADFTRYTGQTYHLNLIAKKPDTLWSPSKAFRRRPQAAEYEDLMQCEEMDLQYSTESINKMIAKANEKGFLVIYNHPTWSCQSYPDYAPLKGLWGVELRNSASYRSGHSENNHRVFKDLLRLGNKIYPVGADDMHGPQTVGLSWIMVGAPQLSYGSVIAALEKGDFYMSSGPEIHSLEIDGNILRITCSDAQYISLESHCRYVRRVAAEGDAWIREAEFDLTNFFAISDDETMCVHLTVTAPDGTYAATRAYYLNELK